MTLIQLALLAIIQGLTEFLPISSSAHLIMVPWVTGEQDQGPLIDVMAHLGSLLAVMLYFRSDLLAMAGGGFDLLRGRKDNPASKLLIHIIVATPFALVVGAALFALGWVEYLRDPLIIGIATIFFGIVLWFSDRSLQSATNMEDHKLSAAVWIGVAQVLAFIPGTSRSGITMTAARFLGINRKQAARFSMLLSIPLLAAMGGVALLDLLLSEPIKGAPGIVDGLIVAGFSAVTAWVAIHLLMHLVQKIGFTPFVIYRIIMGLVILWFVLV